MYYLELIFYVLQAKDCRTTYPLLVFYRIPCTDG